MSQDDSSPFDPTTIQISTEDAWRILEQQQEAHAQTRSDLFRLIRFLITTAGITVALASILVTNYDLIQTLPSPTERWRSVEEELHHVLFIYYSSVGYILYFFGFVFGGAGILMFFSSTFVAIRGLSVPDFQPQKSIGEKELIVNRDHQTIDEHIINWIQNNQQNVDDISHSLKESYDMVHISSLMSIYGIVSIGISFFAAYQFIILVNIFVSMFMIGVILDGERGNLKRPERKKGEYIPPSDIWIGMKSSFYPLNGFLAKWRRRFVKVLSFVLLSSSFVLVFVTPI